MITLTYGTLAKGRAVRHHAEDAVEHETLILYLWTPLEASKDGSMHLDTNRNPATTT